MKKNTIYIICSLFIASQLISGCAAVEGIFKAGVWSGVIIVVIIIALIIFVISKISKK